MTAFTLRSAAGLPTEPPPLGSATVLVIDAQREYSDGGLPLDGVEAATAQIARVLDAARSVGAPVVHIAHDGRPGGLFDPERGGLIMDAAAPKGAEVVIRKTLPNAFAGTGLADHLSALGARPLVIVGFMTHMCVSATARSALDHGIETVVVADAAATRDLPAAVGDGVVAASTLHHSALAELADRFSVVAETDAVLSA